MTILVRECVSVRSRTGQWALSDYSGHEQLTLKDIDIVSKPARGTQVRMIFRVAEQANAGADSVRQAAADARNDGQRRCRLLLVENNDDVRDLADAMLQMAGYDVVAAHSGERALAILDGTQDVHLLFTDVMMPGRMIRAALGRAP